MNILLLKQAIEQLIDIEPGKQTFSVKKYRRLTHISTGQRLEFTASLPAELVLCVGEY